ncbi:MAG: type II toxin-antitoxin system Phd/YefM family antitoxin [Acidobacteria bacterium]|nr:MAG: type II toxin-antitoxin system Phd/YefM family antitoxin [Acidobacteriota bacterium]MCL4286784.1 type II toxin-antitoxin system prevent-host-death family antitoxin [Thermoleophilia bacterium]GIK78471.1 MAG: antitoxin [Actinomycetes bacterium]
MEISASQFKARCLALLDEVAGSGAELIVTKRGAPVARVGPVDPDASLVGSAEQLVGDEELVAPVGGRWDAERGPA